MPSGHHHRAGSLKQSNKKNKRSNASKRSLSRSAGGKVAAVKSQLQRQLQQSKTDRRHRQEQIRQNKRQELLRKRRGGGMGDTAAATTAAPRIVGIINLGVVVDNNLEERIRTFLTSDADHQITPHEEEEVEGGVPPRTVTVKYNVHKKDGVMTLLTCSSAFADHHYPSAEQAAGTEEDAMDNGDSETHKQTGRAVLAALDLARVADLLVFVVDGNAPQNGTGDGENNANGDPILDMHIGSDVRSTTTGKTGTTAGTTQQKWDHLISDTGDAILTALKAQGLPTVLTVLAQTEQDPLDAFATGGGDADHMTMQSVKSLRRSSVKRRLDLKKYVTRFATTEFGNGNDKVVEVDLSASSSNNNVNDADDDDDDDDKMEQDHNEHKSHNNNPSAVMTASTASAKSSPSTLIRTLCSMNCAPAKWVANSPRAYLVSDRYSYDATDKELSICGYVRGMAPWDVNALVHIPCLGTFAPKSMARHEAPIQTSIQKKRKQHNKNNSQSHAMMDDQPNDHDVLVVEADTAQQESLNMFATPDALAGEQNLIGFDDEKNEGDDGEQGQMDEKDTGDDAIARPAGWSDYQSAWLDAVDQDQFDGEEGDRGELALELNQKKDAAASVKTTTDGEIEDLDEANNVSQTERQSLLEQRKKEQSEHEEFPDEVQVGEGEKASDRFARYRSLKSFRKSRWDPKENLPESYATLYHFSSFKATQRTVMNDMKESMRAADATNNSFFGKTPPRTSKDGNEEDVAMAAEEDSEDDFDPLEGCVPTGAYVKLTLAGVSEDKVRSLSSKKALLTAVSMLEHENKVSVLHMGLSQSSVKSKLTPAADNALPIKSKDVLTFRCGWRTWQARPIFSQNNLNCDKHKFERFLPTGGAYFAASIFGPVTYTPCPVLVFKQQEPQTNGGGQQELVAAGTMMNADADRIVIKRIILTGYPVRVHKRHATVKYMFYNPEDVKWFKPAELYSKHGLRGNIVESVGEHGTMKCLFNAPIKQHDTVCLPLYKRVYPKYVSRQDGGSDELVVT